MGYEIENIKRLPDCGHYEIYQESANHYSVHLVYLPIIQNVSRIIIQNISLWVRQNIVLYQKT